VCSLRRLVGGLVPPGPLLVVICGRPLIREGHHRSGRPPGGQLLGADRVVNVLLEVLNEAVGTAEQRGGLGRVVDNQGGKPNNRNTCVFYL
jgi:hypothetical protein